MKKFLFVMSSWLFATMSFAQCFTLAQLTPLFTKDFDQQDQYLSPKGFQLNKDSYSPEDFGWDWKNASNNHYVNIKMKGADVYTVQYRLLNDAACFKVLYKEAMRSGFKKNYQKKTSSTSYNYYKNDKFGLETAEWMSEGKKFFQFNLANLKYFESIKHQWDSY
jgi:hypothetical protein